MKKIFISLLMIAATVNAMAITYTGRAQLTLKSSDNKSCTLGLVESEDLVSGLNEGRYAELNTEGKEVLLYVVYGGVNYATFASNAATMQDLQLGVKTNASTTYTLTASNVTGSLKIKFAGVEYTIDANGVVFSDVALAANSVLPAAGDEANFVVNPSAPAVPSICFNYNHLIVTGYAGSTLKVEKAGVAVVAEQTLASDNEDFDLSAESGRLVVTLDGVEYQIDANPAVNTL